MIPKKLVLPQIAPDNYAAKWVENIPNEVYHADKSHVGSTDLRRIMKSPWNFYQAMLDRASQPDDDDIADHFRFGNLFHMAVLEPKRFFSTYVRMPAFVGKTKDGRDSAQSAEAKAMRDAWRKEQSPDAVIVTDAEFAQIEGMVNSVLSHRDACGLLKNGKAEISGYYRDPATGVQCKFRPDFMNFEMMSLVDVKTSRDCSVAGFQKSIMQYNYFFQMAMYCEGVRQIMDRVVNYPIFMVVEKMPPYEVALYVVDDLMMSKGNDDYNHALRMLRECIVTNKWPKIQASLQPIGLPAWALKGY